MFEDPPPGSAIARARDYGMDLTLLMRNYALTPSQRLDNGERARRFAIELQLVRERRDA
jgi:hypothetical protein